MSITLRQVGSAGHYVADFELTEEMVADSKNATVQTVIILDRSSSMSTFTSKMVNQVFPIMLQKLGYQNDDMITMITFDSVVESLDIKVGALNKHKCFSRGCTKMAKVFDELKTVIHPATTCLRIIAISDGEIYDVQETMDNASMVAAQLKSKYQIVCRAVRLFTSSFGQPDTRGLASVLQFNTDSNNHTNTSLVDISARESPDHLAQVLTKMCEYDKFTPSVFMKSSEPNMLNEPWSTQPSISTRLKVGKNLLWFKTFPKDLRISDESSLKIVSGDRLSHDTIYEVLGEAISYYTDQLKLLRVIGNNQSMETVTKIVQYFKNLESSLAPPDELLHLKKESLKNRATFLRKMVERRAKSFTIQMETIANDERVATLNQAQKADYLRQVDVSRNAKGLARRAEGGGLDFDKVARDESRAIAAHINEIKFEVDDSNHAVSFYSQATTKEGLIELADLVNETEKSLFESMTATELLELFNIVGVPCTAPIGEYPDPTTYRLKRCFPGYYLSIADLTVAASMGGALRVPGTDIEINTVVPVFECKKLQTFLQKYAPTMLEYSASIGMRRMITNVPKTYENSFVAGIWQMILQLNTNKSEVIIKLFAKLVRCLENAPGRSGHLVALLKEDQDPSKSHFLDHNGIAAIMPPLLQIISSKETLQVPRVMRALYSYEFYLVMKKMSKGKEGISDYHGSILDELLGIDYRTNTPLPEMFSPSLDPEYSTVYKVSHTKFEELSSKTCFIKYLTLMVPFFEAVCMATTDLELLQLIKRVPQLNEDELCKYLGVSSYQTFALHNFVEALLYTNKQSRIDKEANLPLLPDLGNEDVGDEMIENVVRNRYKREYEDRLKEQENEELKELRRVLVQKLLSTDNIDEFHKLLQQGTSIGTKSHKITSFDSAGFPKLLKSLLTYSRDQSTWTDTIPLRYEKLQVLYTGKDSKGEVIWNNGNVCRFNIHELKHLLVEELNQENKWENLIKKIRSQLHIYRRSGLPNRHGYSNENPSFYAMGFKSLREFKEMSSEEVWNKYKAKNPHCCVHLLNEINCNMKKK